MATTNQVVSIEVYAGIDVDEIETQQLSLQNTLVTFVKKFPWFLFTWTFVLMFVFVNLDKDKYSYGCQNGMFYWKLMTYDMFHQDIKHLVFNLIAFWIFGLYVNFVYHDALNIIIYTFGVIAAGCAYYIECSSNKSDIDVIGASGGICAIIGAVFVISVYRLVSGFHELGEGHDNKEKLRYIIKYYMFSLTNVFNVIGIVAYDIVMFNTKGDENISQTAHFGGYISGMVCGLFVIINDKYIKNK
jgi:membrane associated rhomboid family serine protease